MGRHPKVSRSHTPRLAGHRGEVVIPQLRAWDCLMEAETTEQLSDRC